MMNWLRNFMMGRYGADQLTFATMAVYLLLALLTPFTGPAWPVMQILMLALLVWSFFRMLSRNASKRAQENQKFLKLWNPVKNWFKVRVDRAKDKTHRYYKCPKCGNVLRVPRGKGKIQITCPVCHTEFIKKT